MKIFILFAGILNTFVTGLLAQNTDLWSRVIFHDGIVAAKNIDLAMVSQEPSHLMGDLVLSATEKHSGNVFSVAIHQGRTGHSNRIWHLRYLKI
jgi:hypothetical protein